MIRVYVCIFFRLTINSVTNDKCIILVILVHLVAKYPLFHPSLIVYNFGCQSNVSYRYTTIMLLLALFFKYKFVTLRIYF